MKKFILIFIFTLLSVYANATDCNNLILTLNTYTETDNLIASIQGELGSDYTIADWNDITAISDLSSWTSCMGFTEDQMFMVTYNGNYLYSSNRQYFVIYSTDGVASSFMVHAQIGNFYLGSWYGLNQQILAKNSAASSVNEASLNKISFYPNPAKDKIEIDGLYRLQTGQIDILDLNGKIIKSFNIFDAKSSIDISKLSSGLYSIRIKTDEGIKIKKLIVE